MYFVLNKRSLILIHLLLLIHQETFVENKISTTRFTSEVLYPHTILKVYFLDGREQDFQFDNRTIPPLISSFEQQAYTYLRDNFPTDWVRAEIIQIDQPGQSSRQKVLTNSEK